MSGKIDYNHESFKRLLNENPFALSLPSVGDPIEKHLESYPMFYTLVTQLANEHYRLSNGLSKEILKRLLRLKMEADIYEHLLASNGYPKKHPSLDRTQTYVREMLCVGFKFRNSLISSTDGDFANSLHETADTLYGLAETCEEHLPYLEYDEDFHESLSSILFETQELLTEVMEYALVEKDKEEEIALQPEIFEIKRDLFVNSLGLSGFNKLPIEKRMELLDGWQRVLLRHRLVLGEYFKLPVETDDLNALHEARNLIKELADRNTTDQKKVDMLDLIRDIHVSLGTRLTALKEHCTNTPIPLFLEKYENFYKEVTSHIHRSMN